MKINLKVEMEGEVAVKITLQTDFSEKSTVISLDSLRHGRFPTWIEYYFDMVEKPSFLMEPGTVAAGVKTKP